MKYEVQKVSESEALKDYTVGRLDLALPKTVTSPFVKRGVNAQYLGGR